MDKNIPRDPLELALAQITERALTRTERYGHLVLALFSVAFAVGIAGLLLTEPDLPLRTSLAFSVMILIGLAWAAFGLRVLWGPAPVLANREIVAGRMSVFFSALFTLGAMFVGNMAGDTPFTPAAFMGSTLTAIALALLVRAHLRRASLQALRARLEQELSATRNSV